MQERRTGGSGSSGDGRTWRYFLTLPWATMTSDGRVWRRRGEEKAEEGEEAAAVQGSVEAHDGDAIAVCFLCSGVELAWGTLIHFPTRSGFGTVWA